MQFFLNSRKPKLKLHTIIINFLLPVNVLVIETSLINIHSIKIFLTILDVPKLLCNIYFV